MKPSNPKHTDPRLLERARQLRVNQTPAETRLWAALRSRQVEGLKFRRQVPIGPFIADFYCHAARLVVEVDGDVHAGQEVADRERSDWLESQGLRVIRFTNREVLEMLNEVVAEIVKVWDESNPTCGRDGLR